MQQNITYLHFPVHSTMVWPTQRHNYYQWLIIPIAFPVLHIYNIPFFLHSLLLLDNPEDEGSKLPVKVYSTIQMEKVILEWHHHRSTLVLPYSLKTMRPIYRTGVLLPSRCCILCIFFQQI